MRQSVRSLSCTSTVKIIIELVNPETNKTRNVQQMAEAFRIAPKHHVRWKK